MSKKNKFKVGDEVRILDGSDIPNYFCGWTSCMKRYVGKKYIVDRIDGSGGIHFKESAYTFDERGLESVRNQCVVIYRKDNKVIALDKSNGKKAVATCSSDDEFNFETGAKLAFERLFAEEPQPYNGKFVVIETRTSALTVGKIYEVVEGKFTSDDGCVYPCCGSEPIKSFDDLKEYLSSHKRRHGSRFGYYSFEHTEIIEVVE